jgi:hypothetical protein
MFKKLVAPIVVGGVLLGSLAMGGVATAATPSTTTTPAASAAAHPLKARHWLRAHGRAVRAKGLIISASTIGITSQALRADLKSGKSIAQVASANGSSAAAVESALTAAGDKAVARAESAGKLTSTQAAAIEARLPVRIDKIVNHVF